MSWCQQLLRQRSMMREATISGAPAGRLLYDIASPELKLSDVTWGSRECSECLRVSAEAPPGSPPCVFCSFAQPRYFAGMINAALNVQNECTSLGCGVDGQVCGVCSSRRRYRHFYNYYHRQRHVTAMAGGGISVEGYF